MGLGGPEARGRVAYLDGVRAVAILAVLGVHWVNPYLPLAPGGYIGVDIFFVLSGYIITRILWLGAKREDSGVWLQYRRFMRQRVRRLYPALTAFIAVSLAVIAITEPGILERCAIDGSIAAGQGMAIYLGIGGDGAVPFGHTWSLANEWYFYALWPVFVLWAAKRRVEAAHVARWALAAAAALYVASFSSSPEWFYFGPVSRFAEILVGAAAALWLYANPQARLGVRAATILTLIGFVAAIAWTVLGSHEFSPFYRFLGYPIAIASALCLIIPGALSAPGLATRVLSWPPCTYLGRISYSLYLWHLLPLQILDKDELPGVSILVIATAGVMSAMLATLLSYYLVEKPFIRSRSSALEIGDGSRGRHR